MKYFLCEIEKLKYCFMMDTGSLMSVVFFAVKYELADRNGS